MAPQASKKCGLQPPDHHRLGCCTSNSIDSEQIPGIVSVLWSGHEWLRFCREILCKEGSVMMGSWSYYIVSNYRHISRAFVAVIFLFVGTDAVADPILPPVVFHPCLPKVREVVKSPIPLPDPPPFLIGCLIPGCDLALTGPLDLRVELSGDLMPSALLEIDGLSQDRIRMLQLSGEVQAVPDQRTTFKVERGRSLLSGLRVDLGARLQTEDLVTRLMARTVAPIIPTVQLRLSVDAKEAEKWVIRNREVKSQKAEPKIVIALKLIQGKTTINESITEYPLIPCYNIPTHPPDAYGPIGPITLDVDGNPVDWIHVTEQGIGGATVSLGQDAVALANGLIQNGSSPRWISSEAYKGTAFIPMVYPAGQPEDRIETSTDCANDGNTCAEVSVFAKDLGMTFTTLPKENPPKDWKTGLGEIVEIPITQNGPLVVPVEFYILWEHPNDSSNPIDPKASCSAMSSITACLADWWLSEANTVWGNMWSGIQFERREPVTMATFPELEETSCDDLTAVYNRLGLTFYSDPPLPSEQPTAMRVFFVMESIHTSDQGSGTITESAPGWTCTGTRARNLLNNIFISTSSANRTSLAHEFGHALSLWHVNDPSTGDPLVYTKDATGVYPYFDGHNLMWTNGTLDRTNIAKSQAFRGNVNRVSAVHRHEVPNRSLSGVPRECPDDLVNVIGTTCPKIYVDK